MQQTHAQNARRNAALDSYQFNLLEKQLLRVLEDGNSVSKQDLKSKQTSSRFSETKMNRT
jgi:hypothetical protein